jgi:HKD family nuclease
MKIEKFLYETDCQLSAKLEDDLNSNEYSEQDAQNAIVLEMEDCATFYLLVA